MPDPAVPVDHRPPLPPPNPLLGQTVDGNPARSLVDRTPLDLLDAGRYEATEDRRIAGLMRKNRRTLERRAQVTEALVAEVERLRSELAEARDVIADLQAQLAACREALVRIGDAVVRARSAREAHLAVLAILNPPEEP